jgi:hypothetical protein
MACCAVTPSRRSGLNMREEAPAGLFALTHRNCAIVTEAHINVV